MAVHSHKQSRELAVLEILNGSKTALTSGAIADKLGVKPDTIYQDRKVQHIIGDMVYAKLVMRSNHVVRIRGKQLPTYVLTDKGREQLRATKGDKPKHFELAPGVKFEKPEPPPALEFKSGKTMTTAPVRRDKIEEVFEIPASRRELKKPVFAEAKLVTSNWQPSAQKIVPLPERGIPVTPPYPVVGKPSPTGVVSVPTVALEARLRELVESMKGDGGRAAFLQIAGLTLENEQRTKRIEAALATFSQVLTASKEAM